MNRHDAGRQSGLWNALGIGRLAALDPHRAVLQPARTLLGRLEPATRRNIIKAALMGGSALLGFWGFQEVTDVKLRWHAATVWANLFRTFQLLTTQFPNNLPTELPPQLQIARFAMPLFAIWFTAAAVLRRFNRPLLAWVAGLSRDHVVLFGGSDLNVALAGAYHRARRSVVAITPPAAADAVSPIERAGARVVFGDPADPRVLRRAAIHRAAVAIAADDVGTAAVPLATSIAALNRELRDPGRAPLTFLMRLGHRELHTLVATQVAEAMLESRVALRLYVRERTIARGLLARFPADWGLPPGPHDFHAVIVGVGDTGSELLMQLARIAVPAPGRRSVITLIDSHAEGLRDQILAEHPGLEKCAELRFIEHEVHASAIRASDAELWLRAPVPATAIYVCCGDDHANLSMAIGLRRVYARLGVPSPPLFVHQRTGHSLIEALPHIHAASFDTLRVVPFGSAEQEADPFYLVDEEIDELARRMHDNYLNSTDRAASGPAAVPWANLPESYRAANRSQADHGLLKLRALGWHASSTPGPALPAPDAAILEAMAIQEHERWCRDRWLGGWTHDATRDDTQRRHPDLVPYEQLSERLRALDRQTVSALPDLLAGLGIGLRRDDRLGIWIAGTSSGGRGKMAAALAGGATTAAAGPAAHLQLVLPLRSPEEFTLAVRLAQHDSIGIDVVIVRSAGLGDIGPGVDRQQARSLIAAADRAFDLFSATLPGASSEAAALAALCDVCDRVLLGCDRRENGEALLGKMDAARRAKVELIVA